MLCQLAETDETSKLRQDLPCRDYLLTKAKIIDFETRPRSTFQSQLSRHITLWKWTTEFMLFGFNIQFCW